VTASNSSSQTTIRNFHLRCAILLTHHPSRITFYVLRFLGFDDTSGMPKSHPKSKIKPGRRTSSAGPARSRRSKAVNSLSPLARPARSGESAGMRGSRHSSRLAGPARSRHSKIHWERILLIHQRIKSGSFPSATALAAELETSQRTILRDIQFIKDRLRLRVQYDPLRYGFCYTGPADDLPLPIRWGEGSRERGSVHWQALIDSLRNKPTKNGAFPRTTDRGCVGDQPQQRSSFQFAFLERCSATCYKRNVRKRNFAVNALFPLFCLRKRLVERGDNPTAPKNAESKKTADSSGVEPETF
jgi:hypothetical protein